MISPGPVDQTDLVAGYERAASIKPVKKEDLNKVYSEYGLKGGEVKGKSDTALQQRAAKAVVDWWKKQQAAAAPAAPAAKPAAKPAATTAAKPAATVAKPAAPAPVGNAQASAAVRQGNANKARVMQAAEVARLAPSKAPTPAEVAKVLTGAGLGNSKPPAYALVSATALQAWIAKVKYNRALIAKKGSVINAVTNRAPAPAQKPIPHGALPSSML